MRARSFIAVADDRGLWLLSRDGETCQDAHDGSGRAECGDAAGSIETRDGDHEHTSETTNERAREPPFRGSRDGSYNAQQVMRGEHAPLQSQVRPPFAFGLLQVDGHANEQLLLFV